MSSIEIKIKEKKCSKPTVFKKVMNTHIEELIDDAFEYLKKKYGRENI